MANATKYVDNVNGNNGNTGDSEAQAYADIATAIANIAGGGNLIYVQAGSSYTLTSSVSITSTQAGDTTDGANRIEGYTTTPGARDGRPTITSATNSVSLFGLNNVGYWDFEHLQLTHTAATRGNGISRVTANSTQVRVHDCIIDGCAVGIGSGSAGQGFSTLCVAETEIKNCTSHAVFNDTGATFLFGCYIHDNTGSGWINSSSVAACTAKWTIFAGNNYGMLDDPANRSNAITAIACVFTDNTNDGIASDAVAASGGSVILDVQNCIFYGNGGYGIDLADSTLLTDLRVRGNHSNAYGSNTSGARNNLSAGHGDVTLTADPFTNSAAGDFSPNDTAGGGAACRAAGFPGAFPGGTTTGYLDIGAAQHQDSGVGGSSGEPGNLHGGIHQ